MRVYLHSAVVASKICEIPTKFKLIAFQGHRSSYQSKFHTHVPISHHLGLFNSSYERIISYRFRDIDVKSQKTACFPHRTLV